MHISWMIRPIALGAILGCSESGGLARDDEGARSAADASPSVDAAAADGAAFDEVLEVRLAPRARVSISFDDWLDGGHLPRVTDAGAPALASRVDGSVLTVDALRRASGSTTIEVGSETGAAHAKVNVTVDPRPWAYVCDVAYETDSPLADAASEVRVAEAWSSDSGRHFGTESTVAGTAAFEWTTGQMTVGLPVPVGATESTARHRSGTNVWGSVRATGAPAPAYFDIATKSTTVLPWTSAAELFFESAGMLAGARWEGSSQRAIQCATHDEATCELVGPADADDSSARFIEDAGTVVGCGTAAGHRRAFVRAPGAVAAWLPEPSSGCLSGRDLTGTRLGEIDRSSGETWGYVASTSPCEVRVDRAWGTRLLGSGEPGVLLGSARDVSGSWRAVSLTPIPSTSRIRYSPAPEPTDPGLAHACGHTNDPSVAIVASDTLGTAGAIVRTHTNYRVTRDAGGDSSHLELSNARPGKATLHMSRLVPVRVTDPDGSPVPVSFADRTSKCPSLVSFVQLDLAKVGTYVLTLGPTPVDDLHIVYERTWVVHR
ncbi:MAG: hypothetical protein KF850_04005 [Labilithrix sp.]|nr:hypothetical protein [Labilithrix sp.]MBX3211173.1 hypothetical protein [Labilithrix sp.]